MNATERILPREMKLAEMEDNDEAEVKIMEESATFSELVVWGHEALPEDASDPYVRGIEEWVAFASKVCLGAHLCCIEMLMMRRFIYFHKKNWQHPRRQSRREVDCYIEYVF